MVISEARQELIDDLKQVESARYVYDGWQDQINTPALVAVPDEPYVVAGTRFGEKNIHMRLFILVKQSTSLKQANADLDDMIDDVLNTLHGSYALGEVEQPSAVNIGGTNYLGTDLQIIIERSSTTRNYGN